MTSEGLDDHERAGKILTTMRATWRLLPALVGFLVASCGGVSERDIARWKADPDGATRLVAALKDSGASPAMRARAAAALVETAAVDRMASALAGIPIEERAAVIPVLVPLVAASLAAPEAARAQDAEEALFAARQQATTDNARRAIDAVLLPALGNDLRTGRTTGGRHTVAEMLTALGAASVSTLLAALDDGKAPPAPAYEVLDKVGDKTAKEKGGASVARRARGEARISDEMWAALGTLGGKDAIAFLQGKIEHGAADETERAAQSLTKIKRDPSLLPFALRVAANTGARPAVRDRMLEVIREAGGENARKGLVRLMAAEADAGYRYRLFEAALKMSGGAVLLAALEAFPTTAAYDIEDIRRHMVDPIYSLGFDNREGLYKALGSKSPFARMVAVLALEKSGLDSDAAGVAKLSKDRAAVKGFAKGRTVGAEAARVAAALKKTAS